MALLDTSYSRDVVAPVESLAKVQCYHEDFQWIILALDALVAIVGCLWRWWHRCEPSSKEASETFESDVDRAEEHTLSTLFDRPIAAPTLPREDRRVYSDPFATEVPIYVPRRRRLAKTRSSSSHRKEQLRRQAHGQAMQPHVRV